MRQIEIKEGHLSSRTDALAVFATDKSTYETKIMSTNTVGENGLEVYRAAVNGFARKEVADENYAEVLVWGASVAFNVVVGR